jgi:hypothetical protein
MTVAINRGFLSRMPSAWFCGGAATIAVVYSKDPILMPLLIAAWVSMMVLVGAKNYFDVKLVNANGGDRLTLNKAKWNRDKARYFIAVAIVAAITGIALTADITFAQQTGGGVGCTNLGFLNPLGTYATSVLQGFAGPSGGGSNILDSMCTFIGWILLITVVGGVSAISYFSVQLIQSPGNLGTSIYVLIVPVFFVLGSLAFFAIVGI